MEPNSSTTKRECLAVVWASFLLRPSVKGPCFTVRSDDAALNWMLHMNGAYGRLARWRLWLAKFDYVVKTRLGASHYKADTMSRISTPAGDKRAGHVAVPCLALPSSPAT